jgi:hypothetical protein
VCLSGLFDGFGFTLAEETKIFNDGISAALMSVYSSMQYTFLDLFY